MDGSLFMRALAVIAFLALAFPGRAEMDALSVSCSAAPSLPSPVLVVYGSEEPGSAEPAAPSLPSPVLGVYGSEEPGAAEARWLKALQPGTEERRTLDEYVRDVQFVTVPRHPSVKDWEEDGSLSRAAMHGVRMLPSVVFLDSKGRVFDLVEGGSSAASLREKVSLLAEKAQRVRPVTRVNDIPKGGDPAAEASAICRELEQVPPEAWFRDYPGTMKRLEKLNCTVPAFLNAREAALRLEKNRKTAELLGESFRASKASSIRTCLEAWRACADDPRCTRLEKVLYREAHTPESEDAFNQAVAVLEEVRDMNRSSVCGRRAHQLREELRRARLAAARYD